PQILLKYSKMNIQKIVFLLSSIPHTMFKDSLCTYLFIKRININLLEIKY
ncbi:hypothetical protein A5868_001438, partial [Enterococcus sp. 12F9_DIV0723]